MPGEVGDSCNKAKSGDKKNALAQANKAIEIAKNNNQDYSETQKLIDLIENKKKR